MGEEKRREVMESGLRNFAARTGWEEKNWARHDNGRTVERRIMQNTP
jgi:hypothetical protein